MLHKTLLEPRLQQRVREQCFHTWPAPTGKPWALFYKLTEGSLANNYLVRFVEIADFFIGNEGLQITVCPSETADAAYVDHLYTNLVSPLALSLQGKLVLHASAVEINAKAVLFVGESGSGKSTLATGFANAGYRLLADDSAELEFQREYRIYFLGSLEASTTDIAPLHGMEVLAQLMRNSFLLDVESRAVLTRNFDQLAPFANRRIFYSLNYPRRHELLPQLCKTIAEHA